MDSHANRIKGGQSEVIASLRIKTAQHEREPKNPKAKQSKITLTPPEFLFHVMATHMQGPNPSPLTPPNLITGLGLGPTTLQDALRNPRRDRTLPLNLVTALAQHSEVKYPDGKKCPPEHRTTFWTQTNFTFEDAARVKLTGLDSRQQRPTNTETKPKGWAAQLRKTQKELGETIGHVARLGVRLDSTANRIGELRTGSRNMTARQEGMERRLRVIEGKLEKLEHAGRVHA